MNSNTNFADFRNLPEFFNHEMVIGFSDQQSGLRGYIGIHNTDLGPALGGTRMQVYDTDEAALKDVLNLSRAMSYKCALANLPYGGGKGVIIANDLSRNEALLAYARIVENLRGLFKTGTDVGVSDDDVVVMGGVTKHMLGLTEADRGDLTTSSCAALGVFYSMKATLRELFGSENFHDKKIAIKGVGKLGGELARLLSEAGATLVLADIEHDKAQNLAATLGAEVMTAKDIHKQHVDIYAPCALGNELDDITIRELNTKAVVGGANNQLANVNSGQQLFERSILYAPDYIANAGGLIYVADELEPGGFNKQRVLDRVAQIQQTMTNIFERAKHDEKPTYLIADTLAMERIHKGLA